MAQIIIWNIVLSHMAEKNIDTLIKILASNLKKDFALDPLEEIECEVNPTVTTIKFRQGRGCITDVWELLEELSLSSAQVTITGQYYDTATSLEGMIAYNHGKNVMHGSWPLAIDPETDLPFTTAFNLYPSSF